MEEEGTPEPSRTARYATAEALTSCLYSMVVIELLHVRAAVNLATAHIDHSDQGYLFSSHAHHEYVGVFWFCSHLDQVTNGLYDNSSA
ncbi:hypothetical protein EVAR_96209_1 [Eumeta japonica]|uniref:Uncharacterized protein n=1 Tax=Eumeta variegata TaxID=151549 RepID=A0A4C1T7W5_EUMVA|nr:hypothetical protein EVAR_96209_1 [Eumeta japonica]